MTRERATPSSEAMGMERKLCVEVRKDGFSIKNPWGKTVEDVKLETKDTLASVEASLEASAKFSRGIIYIFTEDSRAVKWLYGSWRVKSKANLENITRIKLTESLFRTVRYFHVRRC